METFYGEVEKLRDQAIQSGCQRVQCKSVVQSVKAICAVLYKMETIDVIRAIQRLYSVTMEKVSTRLKKYRVTRYLQKRLCVFTDCVLLLELDTL